MNSVILKSTARVLIALFGLLSIFLLLRGHNLPGGGFIGGLVGAAGFVLYAVSHGVAAARHALRLEPDLVVGAGLVVAVLSGLPGGLTGKPFLSGRWFEVTFGDAEVKLGTPLLFDVGVYLVVVGVVLMMVFALEEA